MVCCPWCSTLQGRAEARLGSLGSLGWLTHFRCRHCGGGFHKEAKAIVLTPAQLTTVSSIASRISGRAK
jgi:hypothetical protein